MKKPSPIVLHGIEILLPAISVLLEFPSDSELQEASEDDLVTAQRALDWLFDLVLVCKPQQR